MTAGGIRAIGVTRRFPTGAGETRLLTFPDLVVAPGELVAITGPTASGKTTLLNLLAGWDRPDTGEIVRDGAPAGAPPWSLLTVVPQQFALVDELDVIENVRLGARAGVAITPDAVESVLDALGLDRLRARSVQEISVGERQRVMIARALAGDPAVILADEPVAHQDRRNADTILRLLRDRATRGAACVVATREADVARAADRRVELGGDRVAPFSRDVMR
jgi:ABC-type lipoprotein export system ATPase subunit